MGSEPLAVGAWRGRGFDRTFDISHYERVWVDAPPDVVVAAMRESLKSHGITEYAVVDHGHDMAAAGVPGIVAWTLVFGNPAAGAKLLESDLAAAVDIPLRLAVIQALGGSEIVLRDMRSLLGDEHTALADAFTQVLRALADDVRAREQERRRHGP
jgi:uncharacterized protein (DUF302 family)